MKIALVGNQNSGKTTLFNLLTGSNQKIGNWPGVTIERKIGIIRNTKYELVDLPGIYSLSPYTVEEEISRKYVFEEKPDLIINIIDSTAIERSLYLTTQLLELDTRVIIALNMADIVEKKGIFIDVNKLSRLLNTTVIKISALKNTGIEHLISHIRRNEILDNVHNRIYAALIEDAIEAVKITMNHSRFVAIKMLEEDVMFTKYQNVTVKAKIKEIQERYDSDVEEVIANQRYNYIEELKENVVITKTVKKSTTDKLDKIFLNKWLAIPIFAIIMTTIYMLAVGVVGNFTVDFVDTNIGLFGQWLGVRLEAINTSTWLISLIVDGIVAGVGAVLNFIPQLMILFLLIAVLEVTGYMARIAFFLDKIFRKIGLSGKSLIPFIVGSGCSVPGIMACRTIEDEEERKMTIFLTPFIPCSAKLPIIIVFSSFFFEKNQGFIAASLYFLAIIVIVISALILKKILFKGKTSAYISELPEYKLPSAKYIFRDVFDKTWSFMKRAGSIILLCSIIVWFMLSFSWTLEYGVDVEQSILAGIGNALAWIFYPIIGEYSWAATVSAIQGLVAKEQVISSMAIIAGFGEDVTTGTLIFGSSIFAFFTPLSAYTFMMFNLFSAPCFGAIGAMRRELGSTKQMLKAIGFQTGLALIFSAFVFGVGTLIGVIA
ncbi:MAG: ferrous iron transport protein B [Bacilli bacterium]|jgi:ferrous iron transport protein B|nr:ferrous iron transport protein B [Bacilli bacterium]MDD3348563.1 ferrous iron transport protein B [Bacilli bacterium]MDD4056194.1 ferrous iron transport protein B [Bacilli bacterium]MDY0208810.1 ferrous iron transport protein B [Bacilli bacterium]